MLGDKHVFCLLLLPPAAAFSSDIITEPFPLAATHVQDKTPPAPCLTDEVEVVRI